jgi:hypothetical protein
MLFALWSLDGPNARHALRSAIDRAIERRWDEELAACIDILRDFDEHTYALVNRTNAKLIKLAETLSPNEFPAARKAALHQLTKAWFPDQTPSSMRIFRCFCKLAQEERGGRNVSDFIVGRLNEFPWLNCDPVELLVLLDGQVPKQIAEKLLITYIKRIGVAKTMELVGRTK